MNAGRQDPAGSWYLAFDFAENATGGGSAFLSLLQHWLEKQGKLASKPEDASIILFNSHHSLPLVAEASRTNREASVIHRIDGPMRLYNRDGDLRDNLAWTANAAFADGTIFQSSYSRDANQTCGFREAKSQCVIHNTADARYFYPAESSAPPREGDKVRLIASSWSANPKKGGATFQWMDEHLDWSRYEMVLVGNSAISYRHIQHIPPADKKTLGEELRKSDIYVAASRKDPCSNALLEAMACGLPAMALNDGGHPELIGDRGRTFAESKEIPSILEEMRTGIQHSPTSTMDTVGESYLRFGAEVMAADPAPVSRKRIARLKLKALVTASPILHRLGY